MTEGSPEKDQSAIGTLRSGMEIVERYKVDEESEVTIKFDRSRNSYVYEISARNFPATPGNTETLRDMFLSSLDSARNSGDSAELKIRKWVESYLQRRKIKCDTTALYKEIVASLFGYGKVDIPMKDENVEDISCGGFQRPVFVYHKKYGSMETNIFFENESELIDFVTRIAERSNSHISVSRPIVESTLPDGSRFQGTYGEEITKNGSTFSIRKFSRQVLTPIDLIRNETIDSEIASYLWQAVESGMSFFIIGGTASGKTTTLNSILHFVPGEKKIISIEDTRELNIPHSNWIPLYTRPGKGAKNQNTGKRVGDIDMFDLLAMSLRQRADYMIVGEVRGQEARAFFQAMSSGQPSMATFHASDVESFVRRLEGEPIGIPRAMISSLDIIIIQGISENMGKASRKIVEIHELDEYEGGEVAVRQVYSASSGKSLLNRNSPVYRKILSRGKFSADELEKEIDRKKNFIEDILKEGSVSSTDFLERISRFYILRGAYND
ncbi:MAG: type II/IV secretion system ATPase subunit [Thermoplasmatales archaeon]